MQLWARHMEEEGERQVRLELVRLGVPVTTASALVGWLGDVLAEEDIHVSQASRSRYTALLASLGAPDRPRAGAGATPPYVSRRSVRAA